MKKIVIIVCLCFAPAIASAAVAVSDTSTSAVGTGVQSLSWSHTTSGSDRLLFVVAGAGDDIVGDRTVDSVTYNGVSLTNSWSVDDTIWDGNSGWYLVAPTIGSNTVLVTYTAGTTNQAAAGATSFSGVHQSTPVGTSVTDTSLTGHPSVTVSSASGDMVIGGTSTDSNTIIEGGTLQWERENVGSDTSHGAQTYAGAASVSVTWTQDSPQNWCAGGVSIRQSVAAATGVGSKVFMNGARVIFNGVKVIIP